MFRKRRAEKERLRREKELETDPFAMSPFNADVIRPGDPGWSIFEAVMKTGNPVIGTYDARTGEVVNIEEIKDDNDP